MKYPDLNERRKEAIKTYREQMNQGFIIEDKCGYYPDDDPSKDAHIEERISTPWYFNGQPVEVYTDINLCANDKKCANMQFMVDGNGIQTFYGINGQLKAGRGGLADQIGIYVKTDKAVAKIEEVACNGVYLFHVPFYKEFMINENYIAGLDGEPIVTEQDYINNLEDWGETLTDPDIIVCGSITRIEDLHIACESAPDFNGGRGGDGVTISPKLREYLAHGKI